MFQSHLFCPRCPESLYLVDLRNWKGARSCSSAIHSTWRRECWDFLGLRWGPSFV